MYTYKTHRNHTLKIKHAWIYKHKHTFTNTVNAHTVTYIQSNIHNHTHMYNRSFTDTINYT